MTDYLQCGHPHRMGIAIKKGRIILSALFLLTTASGILVSQDLMGLRAPGKMVDIGGYRLHVNIKGQGSPAVVIEPGTGSWSIMWNAIQDEIAKTTTVITYDRAGYGWSDASPFPRTGKQIAEELHNALVTANIPPPYVIAGHSYGGYIARIFADVYSDEVAGIALIESAHEKQFKQLPPIITLLIEKAKLEYKSKSRKARTEELNVADVGSHSSLPVELQESYKQGKIRPEYYESLYGELEVLEITIKEVEAAKHLGQKPLMVLTAGRSFNSYAGIPNFPVEEGNRIWLDLQRQLTALSSNSTHLVSDNATHDIHMKDPEMTVESIRALLREVSLRGTRK